MPDDTESKPPEHPLATDGVNPSQASDAIRAEIAQSEGEEFPEKLYCPSAGGCSRSRACAPNRTPF
jgi:hypothetical protein